MEPTTDNQDQTATRFEIIYQPEIEDARRDIAQSKLKLSGLETEVLSIVDVYTTNTQFTQESQTAAEDFFVQPVVQTFSANKQFSPDSDWDYAIEIGSLPGVTDNPGKIACSGIKNAIHHHLEKSVDQEMQVHSSQVMFVKAENLTADSAYDIGLTFANPLIQRVSVKSKKEWLKNDGMDTIVPTVILETKPETSIIDILNADETELLKIGKYGILDHETKINEKQYKTEVDSGSLLAKSKGTLKNPEYFLEVRRGPLALDRSSMNSIVNHYKQLERNPTDIELETLAQTWSEHCKHTIFSSPLITTDGQVLTENGIYKDFIKRSTQEIEELLGDGFVVSRFTDNAGAIRFDEYLIVWIKKETHNSPSALDPYGGAITGIVGVNRDPMGAGMGSRPFLNGHGYCTGHWNNLQGFFKKIGQQYAALPPRKILEGVIEGVKDGANKSGIPDPFGFLYILDGRKGPRMIHLEDETDRNLDRILFEGYDGKPLVFVETAGVAELIIPNTKGKPQNSFDKKAENKDYIVVIGNRVGLDGIHGATFSSEELSANSPATAVQIGDAYTQKVMSDALQEARSLGLYNSITDNGAGGISCSVLEMAKEAGNNGEYGGCVVNLDLVPTKYPGMSPWQTWISESQERMTLSVPKHKIKEFQELMKKRNVESTIIGEFNDNGRAIVTFDQEREINSNNNLGENVCLTDEYIELNKVLDLDMKFLHDGMPIEPLTVEFIEPKFETPTIIQQAILNTTLCNLLARPNIGSQEFIINQYDHEVQGGSVVKPLVGDGRVQNFAAVTKPSLDSQKGIANSAALFPLYGQIDMYDMAAATIDTAIRNIIAVGGSLKKTALMDNFCWCSSKNPKRLGQLYKATQACYDVSTAYQTPFISGKDSMFNDSVGFDKNDKPIKISVPPTLVVSSASVVEDVEKCISLEAKEAGDLVYVIGTTNQDEIGGSEFIAMRGEQDTGTRYIGGKVPKTNLKTNQSAYSSLENAISNGYVSSACSVEIGGLGIALAKTAIGGQLGIYINLSKLIVTHTEHSEELREDYLLFSESTGRLVITIAPQFQEEFETAMGNHATQIGKVTQNKQFTIKNRNNAEYCIDLDLSIMEENYKSMSKELSNLQEAT